MNRRFVMDATKLGPTGATSIAASPIVYHETPGSALRVAQEAGYVVSDVREEPLYEPGTFGSDAIALRGKKEK